MEGGKTDNATESADSAVSGIDTETATKYLLNAYYKIENDITISAETFSGLGTLKNPFSGVIKFVFAIVSILYYIDITQESVLLISPFYISLIRSFILLICNIDISVIVLVLLIWISSASARICQFHTVSNLAIGTE